MLANRRCAHYVIAQKTSGREIVLKTVKRPLGYGLSTKLLSERAKGPPGTEEQDGEEGEVEEDGKGGMAGALLKQVKELKVRKASEKATTDGGAEDAERELLPMVKVADCSMTVDVQDVAMAAEEGRKSRLRAARDSGGKRTFTERAKEKSRWCLTEFRDHSPWCYKIQVSVASV